jgi:hypothetical protein
MSPDSQTQFSCPEQSRDDFLPGGAGAVVSAPRRPG